MLVAVEPSGDALGAALLRELKTVAPPDTDYSGCGGALMAAEGFQSLFPIEAMSVIGFTDVARALPEGYARARELTRRAAADAVGAVIFVDGWAFSRICAKRMRRAVPDAKLFKLSAPQVWASRPQRVEFVRKYFDGVLCLLPFEPPYFARAGVRAEFIGNPNFQKAFAEKGDRAAFRRRHEIGEAPLVLVLPGSRATEVRRLIEPFGRALKIVSDRVPLLRVAAVLHPAVEKLARPAMAGWSGAAVFAGENEKADAFAAADAALAKSGTVTTELAIKGVPMVVAYRVDPLTALWVRAVATTKFATILNVTAGREVVPELLQEKCRPERLASDLLALLTDREMRLEQVEAFPAILAQLGVDGPPAARLGAGKIAEWMGWPRRE